MTPMELAFNNFLSTNVNALFAEFDKGSTGEISYKEAASTIQSKFDMIYGGAITYTNEQYDNFFTSKDLSATGKVNRLTMMEFYKSPEEWKNAPIARRPEPVIVKSEPKVSDIVEPKTPQVTMEKEFKI